MTSLALNNWAQFASLGPIIVALERGGGPGIQASDALENSQPPESNIYICMYDEGN